MLTTAPNEDPTETRAPLPRTAALSVAETADIDEQAALLNGWNQTYDQISAGPFHGSLLTVALGRTLLFREITSNSLHQCGGLEAGTVAVGVPLAISGNAMFCGRRCDGTQLHVFSGGDAFEFLSPCGLDIAGFVVSETALHDAFAPDELAWIKASLRRPHLRAAMPAARQRLRMVFSDVCEVLGQAPDVADDLLRFSAMSRDVTAAIAAALSAGLEYEDEPDIPLARRSSIVRKARDLALAVSSVGGVSVEDVCCVLGVSRRTLQYCFQETLGMKPSAYLRAVRLNGARRAMKEASSVSDAATLWGFWHFGRFAHDYRQMFGELPSEAFRRFHGP